MIAKTKVFSIFAYIPKFPLFKKLTAFSYLTIGKVTTDFLVIVVICQCIQCVALISHSLVRLN